MNIPNFITFCRILAVPFFFTELVSYEPGQEHHRWIAIWIFSGAALSDALDGFLARITHHKTALGAFLDPLADKLLLLSGYLGLLFVSGLSIRPPLWVTVTIVFRDLMIVLGLAIVFMVTGQAKIQPNKIGKITTAIQMLTLLLILLKWPHSFIFWNLTAFLTILSLVSYFKRDMIKLKAS